MALLTGQQVRDLGYNPDTVSSISNGMYDISQFKGGAKSAPIVQSTVPKGATSSAPLPTAPAGGFQQGGWYDSRQYWNGTFSQPGQIHPESNQQGAGQMVSAEVNAQGSTAAGMDQGAYQTYINSLYGNAGSAGTSGAGGTGATGSGNSDLDKLSSEIKTIQDRIVEKQSEANKRIAENNANPFLSEANRIGGQRRIQEALDATIANDQTALKYAQDRLSTLQEQNKPNLDIQYSTDNAGNMTVITVDKNTGKIISQQNAGKVGKADTSGGSGTTSDTKATYQSMINDMNTLGGINIGGTWIGIFPQIVEKYAKRGVSLDDIYKAWANSEAGKLYGDPAEDPADIKNQYEQARGGIPITGAYNPTY